MRAALIYGAGDIRVENVPDAKLAEDTDAVVRCEDGQSERTHNRHGDRRRRCRAVRGARGEAARHYIPELLPDVLEGRVEPGRVFDVTMPLAEIPAAYQAMADRQALKVLIEP